MDEINSINSMLIECVKASGGSKVVGSLLWPEKSVADAQKLLLACLNDDRPEKLSPDQAYFIEKLAKASGCHVAIEYRAKDMSYSTPLPIEPEDEKAKLMREFIAAQKAMSAITERLANVGLRGKA